MPATYAVVIDGDVVATEMPKRAATSIAAGLQKNDPDATVAVVKEDPSPDAGPVALRAMFPGF